MASPLASNSFSMIDTTGMSEVQRKQASTENLLRSLSYDEIAPDITVQKIKEALSFVRNARKLEKMEPAEVAEKLHDMPDQIVEALSVRLNPVQRLHTMFDHLYDLSIEKNKKLLTKFLEELETVKKEGTESGVLYPRGDFHKEGVVYSLYVDLFNQDFKGLEEKIPHLQNLGVSILWLLPILDSPMFDAGFDIRDYHKIRDDLGTVTDFHHFIRAAHNANIKVIFDVALNHTSMNHPWFEEAQKGPTARYRNFFIWSDTPELYKEARIIFKGLCTSNWEKCGDQYYMHRFFKEQPDLNYKNPRVLLAVSRILIYWMLHEIDGFRGDAVPFLWKDEGTNCENLPKTHSIIKFFRAIIDYLCPGSLLLAEACQPPLEVVQYFGADGDECQVAYHFPLMPRMFLSMADANRRHIIDTLDTSVTPAILDTCQWFIFLRVHDELTLEMVTETERAAIHGAYCRDPKWDFRQGEGVSARLADLLERNPKRISLAYSIMLTLVGTPIIFYGDEFGKPNDETYYQEMYQKTGIPDSRYYVRGRIDWPKVEKDLQDPASFSFQVHQIVRSLILARKKHKAFARGQLEFVDALDATTGQVNDRVLAYLRSYSKETIYVMNNLSSEELEVSFKFNSAINKPQDSTMHTDLLGQTLTFKEGSGPLEGVQTIRLAPYAHHWILLNDY